MTTQLRHNQTTQDPRLDRVVFFDERSRQYPIRKLLEPTQRKPRSYTWSLSPDYYLDQGQEGECVGFSWAQEAGARPCVVPVTADVAHRIFNRAQQLDEWEGENYSGTSVLAGAKACQEMGLFKSYHWAFGIDDLLLALSYKGPVELGIWWYEGMFTPDEKGFVWPTGEKKGGHAIFTNKLSLSMKAVKLPNTWNRTWGLNGDCYLSLDALEFLLKDEGEACVPTERCNPFR